jgi:hypothetical protein
MGLATSVVWGPDFFLKNMNRRTAPTIRTASPTLPIPIPAFAPVDKPLGDDDAVGDEVDEEDVWVWLL